jgi:hypothetical protein
VLLTHKGFFFVASHWQVSLVRSVNVNRVDVTLHIPPQDFVVVKAASLIVCS